LTIFIFIFTANKKNTLFYFLFLYFAIIITQPKRKTKKSTKFRKALDKKKKYFRREI